MFLRNEEFMPHVIELAQAGHEVTIPLRGFSMRPYLEDKRDNAVMVRITEPLKVADVVLAEISPGRYVLHRIVGLNGDKVRLWGDGNLNPDPVINVEGVKLIAKGFYRKGNKKLDSVDSRCYRFYSILWIKLIPLRRWLLAIWRRLPVSFRERLV